MEFLSLCGDFVDLRLFYLRCLDDTPGAVANPWAAAPLPAASPIQFRA